MTTHFKPSDGRGPNAHKPKSPRLADANRVRIIGGQWRSRIIEFPDVEGLRPTANRIRETLFNWLGQTLHDKHCLDLFAGSGALGFEAASRGAAVVFMVESDQAAMKSLKANQAGLDARQCRLIARSAGQFLAGNREKFDVVFLDPPFASQLMPTALGQLGNHLSDDGVVYAEWHAPLADLIASLPNCRWRQVKHGKAGAVHFALLTIAKDEP